MAVIYKAMNTKNGKAYIGFATNFEERQKEHFFTAKGNRGTYFHKAIRKHGWGSFEWQILKDNATLADERVLIEEHQTFENGYNLTRGGEGILGHVMTKESKRKISEKAKQRTVTEKQLETLRENAKRMREMGHTEEVKKKISEAHKGKVFSDEHRANISKNHAAKKETGEFYQSEEYKQKMRAALTGKKRTPEQKERYRLAAIERHKKNKSF